MNIKQLCKEAHQIAIEKGFWDCPYFDGGTCSSPEFEGQTEISSEHCNKNCLLHKADIDDRNESELLMLMVSELGEACEALRHGNPKSEHIPEFSAVEEELADVFIRVADMAEAKGYRLEEAIIAKMRYNKTRPYKHNKQF